MNEQKPCYVAHSVHEAGGGVAVGVTGHGGLVYMSGISQDLEESMKSLAVLSIFYLGKLNKAVDHMNQD